jgi:hypothetical protein
MAIQRRSSSFNGPVIAPVKAPGLPGPPDFGHEAVLQREAVNDAVAKLLQSKPGPEQSVARTKALSSPVLQRFWGMDWGWAYEGTEKATKVELPSSSKASKNDPYTGSPATQSKATKSETYSGSKGTESKATKSETYSGSKGTESKATKSETYSGSKGSKQPSKSSEPVQESKHVPEPDPDPWAQLSDFFGSYW